MTKLNFDEHIKEQFSNSSPEVHPRIWENIIAERKNRRPKGFWFNLFNGRNLLLVAGLIITGGIATWLLVHNLPNQTSPKSNIVNLGKQSNTDNKNNLPATENNSSIDNSKNPEAGNQPSTTNNQTDLNNNDVPGIATANTSNSIYSPLITASQKSTANTSLLFGKKETSDPLSDKGSGSNDPGLNNDIPAGGTLFGRLLSDLRMISTQPLDMQIHNRIMPNVFLPGCPVLEKDAAGNKRYLEFYAGPDYAFRSFSDTGNSTYLQKRKESTQFSSAYSAGVRYTRVFDNGVSLRMGLNYSQINEKFTFVQGNLVQVTYIIDANGDTTGSYTVRGTRYKSTYNKFRSVDVPIVIGYELGNGKLHANINAGATINAYSWQKGDVLDTANQPVNISTGKNNSPYQFKTNVGVGFIGAVSLYYKLNDKLHILAEPYYKHNFSPMNKDNITLKEKYNTVGLKLGIRIDLP